MKARVAVISALMLLAGGCGEQVDAPATGDCQAQVRADGIVYTSYGYSERKARQHSVADRADCDDVGEDPAGSVFSENPEQVTTWAVRGYPPERVLGVRFDSETFAVFVANSVSDAERERIYRDLRPN